MAVPVIDRMPNGDIGGPDQLGVVRGFGVQDPWPVVFDERLDLLAGACVNDRVVRIFCKTFYHRIVGDVKGGDQQE